MNKCQYVTIALLGESKIFISYLSYLWVLDHLSMVEGRRVCPKRNAADTKEAAAEGLVALNREIIQ